MDRAGELRTNPEALLAGWESARILHFNGEGFLTAGGALRFVPSYEIPDSAETYFLGEDEKGTHYYVLNSTKFYGHHEDYKTIRELDLNDQEVGLAVHAQGLSLWHTRHPMCSMCGKETVAHLAGSIRKCIRCETDHYPRTDPAIIVLARDKDDRILLGRQSRWPEHRFSTFAGFVEPGESFESAVVRECEEEAGVFVANVQYVGSQPWPFPASLMVAFVAEVVNPEGARPDGEEILEIKWLSRDSIIEELKNETLLLPPKLSVARAMIEAWYGADGEERPSLSHKGAWR